MNQIDQIDHVGPVDHVDHVAQELDAHAIPGSILTLLDGQNLSSKTNSAVHLSTVDADGWPHTAILSVGEILAGTDGRIRMAISAASSTAANLSRNGQLTLMLPFARGLYEIRLQVRRVDITVARLPLHFFEGMILSLHNHPAGYAEVLSGVTIELLDQRSTLNRWVRQIAALRSL